MEDTYAFVPPNPGDLANIQRKRMSLEEHQRKRTENLHRLADAKRKAKFDALVRQLEETKEIIPSKNTEFILELSRHRLSSGSDGSCEFSEVSQRLEAYRKDDNDRMEATVKKLEMDIEKRQADQRLESRALQPSREEQLKAWMKNPTKTIEVIRDNINEANKDSHEKEDNALKIVQDLAVQDKTRQISLKKAQYTTEELKDADCFKQPANVFERMWTPLCSDNPIYMRYIELLTQYKTEAIKSSKQLAVCSQCMTFFFPCFPNDFHLHTPSKEVRRALDKKKIKEFGGLCSDAEEDQSIPEIIWRNALLALAKEAKAHKSENGCDYIKLLRIAEGARKKTGGAKYNHFEICENHDSGLDMVENTPKVFETKSLAAGIFEIIAK